MSILDSDDDADMEQSLEEQQAQTAVSLQGDEHHGANKTADMEQSLEEQQAQSAVSFQGGEDHTANETADAEVVEESLAEVGDAEVMSEGGGDIVGLSSENRVVVDVPRSAIQPLG